MSQLRLISLLPGATEMIHSLGLRPYQVGRSHECDYPPDVSELPVCSRPNIPVSGSSSDIDKSVKARLTAAASIYELDTDLIRHLRPTHIVTQTQCEVCAVSLEQVENAVRSDLGCNAQIISLEPNRLEDLWRDIRRIALASMREQGGEGLIASLQARMEGIESHAQGANRRPTVAAIEWLEPLMAAGNWIPELIGMAGGKDAFGTAGEHSRWITWNDLIRADPDAIVVLPCGFDLARTCTEMHWLTNRPAWTKLRAVQSGNVFVCDGNQFMSRPGPRLVESLQIFAEILHAELFPPLLQGSGWELFRP